MSQKNLFVSRLTSTAVLAMAVSMLIAPAVEAKVVVKPVKKVIRKHISISAIPGAYEYAIADPTSRCVTKGMKALNATAVKQMNLDIKKLGTDHDAAVATYKDKMATIWSAMEQPYCGYGSQGLTAVRHSFLKSVERTRDAFLKATK